MIQNHPVIALEEHYWHTDVVKKSGGDAGSHRSNEIQERLYEIGPRRIETMDEAGIDVQLLGHGMPATQRMDAVSHASRTITSPRSASPIRAGSWASLISRRPIRKPRPTSSSAV